MRDALAAVAPIGPYFAVELDATGPQWLPLRRLVEDPPTRHERVRHVVEELARRCGQPAGELDARAAASIWFQGLAARVVVPALGTAAVASVVPAFDLADVWWQRVDGGPVPLALTAAAARPAGTPEAAADALAELLAAVVAPLVDAFGTDVSRKVLWGNVGSSLAAAARMLLRADLTMRQDPAQIVTAMLNRPGPLRGAGRLESERWFVRSSCCLFYRIPNGGKCGDCVLL